MGSQLADSRPERKYDGVLGMWYGKAPGLDRACDAIRHAVFAGTSPHGGVVAVVGDDPAAKSSTLPSSSDATLVDLHMPIIFPGDVQEALDLARHSVALSRASGVWVGYKLVTAVADGTGTVDVHPDRVVPVIPTMEVDGKPFVPRADGRLLTPYSLEMEREFQEVRSVFARQYGVLNKLNQVTVGTEDDWLGIAASGHTYHELREALRLLGFTDDDALRRNGVRLMRLSMPVPFDEEQVRQFAHGLAEVIVVEEKNPTLEVLVKGALYTWAGGARDERPVVVGRHDENRQPLIPGTGAIDADKLLAPLRARLVRRIDDSRVAPLPVRAERASIPLTVNRTPFFCSGCPHNISTRVPEGSLVGGGIGCHAMVALMDPARVGDVAGLTAMGNEGAQWIGMSPFVDRQHIIQNLGDGTYFHSGSLAVRAAVAAGVNMTFKLLYNGTVAMTGGQDPQGQLDVPSVVQQLLLEGVAEVIVTTDDVGAYGDADFGPLADRVEVWDRTRLIEAQERLAAVSGVTALVHDQACAAENRRARSRGTLAKPDFRIVINERVCEGCGDCGDKSNCLSVQPVMTEYGRKTRIHQTSCNFDMTCLEGDCPSFALVTVDANAAKPVRSEPRRRRRSVIPPTACPTRLRRCRPRSSSSDSPASAAPAWSRSARSSARRRCSLGERCAASIRPGCRRRPGQSSAICASRRPARRCPTEPTRRGSIASSPSTSSSAPATRTAPAPVPNERSSSARRRQPPPGRWSPNRRRRIRSSTCSPGGSPRCRAVTSNRYPNASAIASGLFGDATAANLFLLGVAVQAGAIPIDAALIERAIELNGVAVQRNVTALRWGRRWYVHPDDVEQAAGVVSHAEPETLDGLIARLADDLTDYQSARYAERFRRTVAKARQAEQRVDPAVPRVHRRRGSQPAQADGVQGRVRGRPAAPTA